MTITCNVTGSERKRLAEALGAILLWEPVYTKAPMFAYVVNDYTVDKTGAIICPDSVTMETVEMIIAKLTSEGFSPVLAGNIHADVSPDKGANVPEVSAPEAQPQDEATEGANGQETPNEAAPGKDIPVVADMPDETPGEVPPVGPESEDTPAEQGDVSQDTETTVSDNDTLLTISVPRSKISDDVLGRLRSIVANKKLLFQRALQIEALPIEVLDEDISFPWFKLMGIDGEAEAYAQFITHLVKMADEQTRVLDKPYDGDNDKFAMRIFMVRMGMKGSKYTLARKLMMKNLTGNSGWRYGAPPKGKTLTESGDASQESPVEEDASVEARDEEIQSDTL